MNSKEAWDKRVANYASKEGLWETEDFFIRRFFGKKGKVLEVGCGAGRTLIPLAKRGFKITGIDISPEMLKAASKRVKKHRITRNVRLIEASVVEIPLKDNSVDHVFVPYHSLDYVYPKEDRDKAIVEMARVIKRDGILIHSFHNIASISGRFRAWYWTPLRTIQWIASLITNGGYLMNKDVLEFHTTPTSERKRFESNGFEYLGHKFGSDIPKNMWSSFFRKLRRTHTVMAFRKTI